MKKFLLLIILIISASATYAANTISLASNTQTAATVCAGATNVVLQSVKITDGSTGSYSFTALNNIVINGTFASGDVTNIKLYWTTSNSFAATTQLGATIVPTGSGTYSFGSFTTPSMSTSTSYWIWIVANIPATLATTAGNVTLSCGAVTKAMFTASPVPAAFTSSVGGAKTIKVAPPAISGTPAVCTGATTALSNTAAGGAWSSSNTGVATVSAGVVTGVSGGTANITYSTGCGTAATITVTNNTPQAITGGTDICGSGGTLSLSDATAGGAWTSGATSVATVNSSGVVTGASTPGTATISYTNVGCSVSKVIYYATAPVSAISGANNVCAPIQSLNYTEGWEAGVPNTAGTAVDGWNVTSGSYNSYLYSVTSASFPSLSAAVDGTHFLKWNSFSLSSGSATLYSPPFSLVNIIEDTFSVWVYRDDYDYYAIDGYGTEGFTFLINTTNSTAGATTLGFVPRAYDGVVTGSLIGTSSPASGGWYQYKVAIPASFNGAVNYILITCVSNWGEDCYLDKVQLKGRSVYSTTYTDATSGGYWASGNTAVATIGSSTGVITGAGVGTSIITYSNGCAATQTINVIGVPATTISGGTLVIAGGTLTLSNATTGGTWTSSNSNATVDATSGVVTGVTIGTSVITYSTGCGASAVQTVTVTNPCSGMPTPGTVSATVTSGSCSAYTSSLSLVGTTVAGGITYQWQKSTDNINWTAVPGATDASYTATVAANVYYRAQVTCAVTTSVAATPSKYLAYGSCIIMPQNATSSVTTCGGLFYASGGPTGSYINNETDVLTIYPGATGTGSKVSVHFTSFSTESGYDPLSVYNGNSVTGIPVFSVSGTSIPGDVTSTAADGSLTFKFTSDVSSVSSGWSAVITNTNPNPITTQPATVQACQTQPASISVAAGGTNTYQWFNNGSVNANTGGTLISGATNSSYSAPTSALGTTYYYVQVTNACGVAFVSNAGSVVVNALPPAIGGTPSVCIGFSTSLTDATGGGTWVSSNTAAGTINSSGVLQGIASGTTTISYTVSGCRTTQVVTVNPLPAAIGGTKTVCVNATTSLTNTGGGTWSSSTPAMGTIGSGTGVLAGIAPGSITVTYTLPTGCISTTAATVNPLPATTITPLSATVCLGDAATFTATAPQPSFPLLLEDFNSGLPTGWTVTNISGTPASYWHAVNSPAPGSGATGDGSQMLEADANDAALSSLTLNSIVTSASFSTLGYTSATLTFNQYLLSLPTDDVVAVEYSIDNGSTWTSMLDQIGVGYMLPGGGSGIWDAAAPEVTVAMPDAALNASNVKLRWNYQSNGGVQWDIDNVKVTAMQAPVSFSWAGVGGASGLACTTSCASNTITPTATGANVYSVTSTTGAGCILNQSVTVSVNPLPANIGGTQTVCVNGTTTLTNSGGGTWSSASANVSVGSSTGVVTGITAGTANVTYTLPTGCRTTAVVTINASPSPSTGTFVVCEGTTTTLTNTSGSGTWSSVNSSIATVSSSGVVTGAGTGNTNILYTLDATGCSVAATVTVNHTPATIQGSLAVCEIATTSLSSTDGGGTWVSGSTAVATIDASGVATGVLAGNSTITYTLSNNCRTTAVLTVNQLPEDITGTPQVCIGAPTSLTDATPGGTWLSSDETIATVDADGVVSGVAEGNAIITYQITATGCSKYTQASVNQFPAAITGANEICQGTTTTLSDADGTGTWSSSATSIAAIDADGVVTAATDGTTTIRYTAATTCAVTMDLTVDPLPADITGTPVACEGLTTTLTSGSTGAWSSSAFGIATVDPAGVVNGISQGIATITYQLPTTCFKTVDVTINPLPAAIGGDLQVCAGLTTTLSDGSTGGNWSLAGTAAAIDADGVVSASTDGTVAVTYTLPTGCIATAEVTVNPLPDPITGQLTVCEGSTTALGGSPINGTWSSSNAGTAFVDIAGVVSGVADGTAMITYKLPTTCITTATVTVNPLPTAIAGSGQVCIDATTTLSSAPAGGTWTSDDAGIAGIGSASGIVSGVSAGNTRVTYTLTTGCNIAAVVTVDPLPLPISGSLSACIGVTSTLTDTDAGGTWASGNPAVASIDANNGALTGAGTGNASIIYTLPTGCKTMAIVTVNPLPAPIAGVAQACEGASAAFTNGSPGGTWISSTPLVATIDPSGNISAIASGTTLVTYTLPTGCLRTRVFTVNAQPMANTGNPAVCRTSTTQLSNALPGGSWVSSAPGIAVVNTIGIVTGNTVGIAPISYVMPSGCNAVTIVTVNEQPAAIIGPATVCENSTVTMTDGTSGSWASGNTSVAIIDATTGIVTGAGAGNTLISYSTVAGCTTTRSLAVNAAPASITGGGPVCTSANLTLGNTVASGAWTSSNTAIATVGLFSGIVTGAVAGTVNISYTLANGCAATTQITVNPTPAPITGPLAVCDGQTIGLASVTPGGTWTSDNTSVATVGGTGTVTTVGPGSAIISYALGAGCMRTATITVNANPAIHTMTGGGQYCEGGAGVHIGLNGSDAGINYQLQVGSTPVGSGILSTGGVLDFGAITAANTYNVIARNLATGCASNMSGTATVVVNPLVTPAITLSASTSDTICEGTSTVFTGAGTNGGTTPTYIWNVNGAPVSGTTSNIYTYTPANTDVVTVTLISSNACAAPASATASKTMTVNPKKMPTVTAAVSPSNVLCAGYTASFSAAYSYGGTAPEFRWYKNGSVAATGSTFAYTPSNGDLVYVHILSNYACRLADSIQSLTINMTTVPVFIPTVSITADPGFGIEPGTPVTLTANVVGGGSIPTFDWYVNGVQVTGAHNNTFSSSTFSDGDSVSCRVVGEGQCGLPGFNSVIIRYNRTGISTTQQGSDILLVPNPNKGEFTVKGTLGTKADGEVMIEVANMLGQVVYRGAAMAHNGTVDQRIKLDNTLANGMYLLNLISENEKQVFHFVIEQ